jgi:pimeloyl-ACP methyl ester carboxylesterase
MPIRCGYGKGHGIWLQMRLCDIGGLRLHVAEWGDRQAPRRSSCCTGWLRPRPACFDLIARSSSAQRFHVFAFDQRGAWPVRNKPNKGYDFETISRDLDGLIARLCDAGQPVTLDQGVPGAPAPRSTMRRPALSG